MNKKTKKTLISTMVIGTTFVFATVSVYLWQDSSKDSAKDAASVSIPSKQNNTIEALPANNIPPNLARHLDPKMNSSSDLSAPPLNELLLNTNTAETLVMVDLDSLKQEIPDNLYWTLGAPTQDVALLELRKETKEHWDKEYGKVLSNTATEEEIRAYYAHQNAVSTDYVEFSTLLINRHKNELSEDFYGLQTLARNLHLARLEEIPLKLTKALERQSKQQKKRQEWLADKESFEANLQAEREEALRALGKI